MADSPDAGSPPPTKGFRMPPALRYFLKFALGAGVIALLVRTGALDPRLLAAAFRDHPGLIASALAAYLILVLASAFARWYLLLRLAGLRVGAGKVFSLFMIGIFFNSLIPGGTGGDIIKAYYLLKEHDDRGKAAALATIAMDRFVGLYALLCLAMLMTAINADLWTGSAVLRANTLFYVGVFAVFTGAVALFLSPWSGFFLKHPGLARLPGGRFMSSLGASLFAYRERPAALLPPLLLGMIVDCGLVLAYFFCARALGMELPLRVHGFVVPTLTMINGIPVSPSGVGVGEAAGRFAYSAVGAVGVAGSAGAVGDGAGGGEVLALVHILILCVSLAAAPFYLLYRGRR